MHLINHKDSIPQNQLGCESIIENVKDIQNSIHVPIMKEKLENGNAEGFSEINTHQHHLENLSLSLKSKKSSDTVTGDSLKVQPLVALDLTISEKKIKQL